MIIIFLILGVTLIVIGLKFFHSERIFRQEINLIERASYLNTGGPRWEAAWSNATIAGICGTLSLLSGIITLLFVILGLTGG